MVTHITGLPDDSSRIWKAVETVDDRLTALEATVNDRQEMTRENIQSAVRDAMPSSLLSDEEHRWVQMAIRAEAQRIAFRSAVIEKSLLGLVWAGVIGIGFVFRDYAISHGMWKP